MTFVKVICVQYNSILNLHVKKIGQNSHKDTFGIIFDTVHIM